MTPLPRSRSPRLSCLLLLLFTALATTRLPGAAAERPRSAQAGPPKFGDTLVAPGFDVRSAEIDEAEYLDVAKFIQEATDSLMAVRRAANLFKENRRIPSSVLRHLPAVFSTSDGFPSGTRIRYSRRFGRERSFGFDLDLRTGIIAHTLQTASTEDPAEQAWAASEQLSREEALGHFKNFLILHGLEPDRLRLTATYYGTGSAILLMQDEIEPMIQPSLGTRYFLLANLARASIAEDTARTRLEVVSTALTPAQRRDRSCVIQAYLALNREPTILLRSTRDIPGYRARPLDADLVTAIRPPFEFKSRRDPDQTVLVFYSYQRIGGIVHRCRIRSFDRVPIDITETSLATGIGAASYYR